MRFSSLMTMGLWAVTTTAQVTSATMPDMEKRTAFDNGARLDMNDDLERRGDHLERRGDCTYKQVQVDLGAGRKRDLSNMTLAERSPDNAFITGGAYCGAALSYLGLGAVAWSGVHFAVWLVWKPQDHDGFINFLSRRTGLSAAKLKSDLDKVKNMEEGLFAIGKGSLPDKPDSPTEKDATVYEFINASTGKLEGYLRQVKGSALESVQDKLSKMKTS